MEGQAVRKQYPTAKHNHTSELEDKDSTSMDAPRPLDSKKVIANRRSFLCGSAATLMASAPSRALARMLAGDAPLAPTGSATNIFVSLEGDDSNPGSIDRPLRTLKAAQGSVRTLRKSSIGTISVHLRQGTYY